MKKYFFNFLLLLAFLCCVSKSNASKYYWQNGSGIWSDLSHWQVMGVSGKVAAVQVPSSGDTVYFDNTSFTATNQKVTIDIKAVCHTFDWRGSCAAYAGACFDGSKNIDIFGSLYFDPGMSGVKYNGQLHFVSNNTGNVIDGKGVQVEGMNNGGTLWFDGSGSWKFLSTWNMNQGSIGNQRAGIVHTLGTVDFNGQIVSTGWLKSASGQTRSLKMDNAQLHIISAHMSKVVEFDPKKLTFTGNNLRIVISRFELGNLEVTASGFSFGSLIADSNIYSLNITAPLTVDTLENRSDLLLQSDVTVNTRAYFLPGSVFRIKTSANLILGSSCILTSNGNCKKPIEIRCENFDAAAGNGTISKSGGWGSTSVSYGVIRNINVSASSNLTVSNSVDFGANSGITFNSSLTGNTLYWIQGNGNWNDPAHWASSSGGSPMGCIPGPMDDVVFDANSFSSNGGWVQFGNYNAYCRNASFTALTKQIALTSTINNLNESFPRGWHLFGSLTLSSKSSFDTSFSQTIFLDGGANHTITSSGQEFKSDVIVAGGGTYTLQDSFTMEHNEELSLQLLFGTFETNKNVLNIPTFESGITLSNRTFDIRNSLVRLSVDVVIGASLAQWNIQAKNLTFLSSGSIIRCDNLSNKNVNFLGGNQTYHTVLFLNPYPTVQINNNNVFDSLIILPNANFLGNNKVMQLFALNQGKTYVFKNGSTQTFDPACIMQLKPIGACSDFITIMSDDVSQANFSCGSGTISCSNLVSTSMNATGGATWNVSNFVDLGNNTGWTTTAAVRRVLYWVGGSGAWSQKSSWSLTSGGAGGECIPTIVDDVIFDANSFSFSGSTVSLDLNDNNCHGMYWINPGFTPTFLNSGSRLNIAGTLLLSSNMIVDFQSQFSIVTFLGTDTDSVTMAGNTFVNVNFAGTGTYYLMDDFTLQKGANLGKLSQTKGKLYTNGMKVNATTFQSVGTQKRTIDIQGSTVDLAGLSNITAAFWVMDSFNLDLYTDFSEIRFLSSGTTGFESQFKSNNRSYNKLNILPNGSNGIVQIIGNNWFKVFESSQNTQFLCNETDVKDSFILNPGGTYAFKDGSKTWFSDECVVYVVGNGSSPIYIQSTTSNVPAIWEKPSGYVCADFIYIKDNAASGGAIFTAGTNSNDQGGNSGWDFLSAYPTAGTGTLSGQYLACKGDSVEVTLNLVGGSLPASVELFNINGIDTTIIIFDSIKTNTYKFWVKIDRSSTLVLHKVWVDKCFGQLAATIVDTLNIALVDLVSDSALGTAFTNQDTLCPGLKAYLYTDGYSKQYYWQQWDGSQWIDLPGNGPDSFSVTGTTKFRAHLNPNPCDTIISNEITVVSLPQLNTGVISPPFDSLCLGGSAFFQASSYQGNIGWEISNGNGFWNDLFHPFDTITINSKSSVWIRNKVSFSTCGTFFGDSVSITIMQPPNAGLFSASDTAICPPAPVMFYLNGAVGIPTLEADTGTGWFDIISDTPWVQYPNVITKYRARLDQPYCGTVWSNSLNVNILSFLSAKIMASANPIWLDQPDVLFTDTGSGATSWEWKINKQLVSRNQSFTQTFVDPGTYAVHLYVENAANCSITDSMILEVKDHYHFYIPNSFSPNGDNLNEIFFPVFRNTKTFEMILFDKWGEIIYRSNENGPGWDGTYRGKECQVDVYMYRIQVMDLDGLMHQYKGSINLIR